MKLMLAQGRRRVQIISISQSEPYYIAKARVVEEPTGKPRETEALMRAVLALFEKCIQLNRVRSSVRQEPDPDGRVDEDAHAAECRGEEDRSRRRGVSPARGSEPRRARTRS